jgi:putative flippase GtrA
VARGVTMLIEVGGFSLLYELLHCPEMLAKVIISVVILVLNYVFSKLLVFRKKG